LWRLIEEATDGSPADAEPLGDPPLADPLLEEVFGDFSPISTEPTAGGKPFCS
jgi:hypothetical protein